MRVTGNILVEGDTTSLDVATLRVEDKQIELAITDDSTLISDIDADDAGIVVRVSGDDKRWTWSYDTDNWTSSHGIALNKLNDSYFIGTANVLSLDTLGSSVVNSSLTTVGKLVSLQIGGGTDTMTITDDTISTTKGLQITSVDAIELTNAKQIKNVAAPTANNDVTNKKYVDDAVLSQPVVMGLDITGIGTTYNPGSYGDGTCDDVLLVNIATILSEISTPSTDRNGTVASIHAYYYTATTDPIDVQSGISKTLTAVDSAGVQNVNVIGDFAITDPTATVNLTITRLTISMEIASALWAPTTGEISTSAV